MSGPERQNPEGRHNPQGHKSNIQHSNFTAAQRARVEAALRAAPSGVNTIQLRRDFDVLMPAARVHELRWNHGLNIQTVRDQDTSESGNRHRVARYVLQPGKWQGVTA